MATLATAATSFLDRSVLARIGNLELLAKTVVEGFINGLHRSPHLGASTDFAEHRPYMPGDDIRRIDWRLFGRTDRHYVKEFEADTNTNFLIVLDSSASMRYRSATRAGAVSKLEYGCYLAAALAYFSSQQRDRVGVVTFDRDIVDYVPPSAKHLQQVLHLLQRTVSRAGEGARWGAGTGTETRDAFGAPEAPGALVPVMKKLSESLRRRSIVLLISDLYEEPGDVSDALTWLHGRGNDLIVSHILDRDELEFPFNDSGSFVDIESRVALPVIPDCLRAQYRELIRAHCAALSRQAGDQKVDYALYDTAKPLDQALFAYLASRQRFSRVR
jgi:uncharacterized protein (DUF58 family)